MAHNPHQFAATSHNAAQQVVTPVAVASAEEQWHAHYTKEIFYWQQRAQEYETRYENLLQYTRKVENELQGCKDELSMLQCIDSQYCGCACACDSDCSCHCSDVTSITIPKNPIANPITTPITNPIANPNASTQLTSQTLNAFEKHQQTCHMKRRSTGSNNNNDISDILFDNSVNNVNSGGVGNVGNFGSVSAAGVSVSGVHVGHACTSPQPMHNNNSNTVYSTVHNTAHQPWIQCSASPQAPPTPQSHLLVSPKPQQCQQVLQQHHMQQYPQMHSYHAMMPNMSNMSNIRPSIVPSVTGTPNMTQTDEKWNEAQMIIPSIPNSKNIDTTTMQAVSTTMQLGNKSDVRLQPKSKSKIKGRGPNSMEKQGPQGYQRPHQTHQTHQTPKAIPSKNVAISRKEAKNGVFLHRGRTKWKRVGSVSTEPAVLSSNLRKSNKNNKNNKALSNAIVREKLKLENFISKMIDKFGVKTRSLLILNENDFSLALSIANIVESKDKRIKNDKIKNMMPAVRLRSFENCKHFVATTFKNVDISPETVINELNKSYTGGKFDERLHILNEGDSKKEDCCCESLDKRKEVICHNICNLLNKKCPHSGRCIFDVAVGINPDNLGKYDYNSTKHFDRVLFPSKLYLRDIIENNNKNNSCCASKRVMFIENVLKSVRFCFRRVNDVASGLMNSNDSDASSSSSYDSVIGVNDGSNLGSNELHLLFHSKSNEWKAIESYLFENVILKQEWKLKDSQLLSYKHFKKLFPDYQIRVNKNSNNSCDCVGYIVLKPEFV